MVARNVATYFDIDDRKARKIAKEVGRAVARWRTVAATVGIKDAEIHDVASAFEHHDLQIAVRGK